MALRTPAALQRHPPSASAGGPSTLDPAARTLPQVQASGGLGSWWIHLLFISLFLIHPMPERPAEWPVNEPDVAPEPGQQ